MSEILTMKQQRDKAVFEEYNRLIEEGNPRTGVVQRLMHKHKIYSAMTIYRIVKREAARKEASNETV
jgi:hypothetical protein